MSFAAIGIGLGTTIVGTALQSALAPGQPAAPNLAAANRAGVEADINTLASRRAIERAAALGLPVSTVMPSGKTNTVHLWTNPLTDKLEKYDPTQWTQGTKNYQALYDKLKANGVKDPERVSGQGGMSPIQSAIQGRVWGGTTKQEDLNQTVSADFTGTGEIQQAAQYAKDMAASNLALQQKYGTQFIEEALRQEELADPEGTAARKLLAEKITKMNGQPRPVSPLATDLDAQVGAELQRGAVLNPDTLSQIEGTLRSRGGFDQPATGDVTTPLTTGAAGEARRAARQQKALSWLSSGATPEDVEYRNQQQNLANMGAFLAGQSPVAIFGQLSGAQQGTTPQITGQPLSSVNPNAGASGMSTALTNYRTATANAANNVNDWLGGLGLALKGASAIGTASTKTT